MSTIATFGRCRPTCRRRSSGVPDCATTSKPASARSRAIPSRSRTVSSASTTLTPAPSVETVLRKRREVAREVVGEQLVDALRAREALEPVLAEVAARDASERAQHVSRDDDLPAVAGVRDARRPNNVDPV